MKDWLRHGDLAYFMGEVVDCLDVSEMERVFPSVCHRLLVAHGAARDTTSGCRASPRFLLDSPGSQCTIV
jgi:hypothetical protein